MMGALMVVAFIVGTLMVLTYLVRATFGGGTHNANISGGGTHGANISSGKQLMAVAYLVGDTRNDNISGWRHFGNICSYKHF
jgi:hypothetical protein